MIIVIESVPGPPPAHEDMRAVYLRSLTSHNDDGDHQWRVRDDHAALDVFSQVPQELSMDYEEDSFCVDDDYQDTGKHKRNKRKLNHFQFHVINKN